MDTRENNGFTLIELLVVIAIIALLVSILLPSLKKAKELAKAALCLSNLHSVALPLFMYANDNQQVLIPAFDVPRYNSGQWFTWGGRLFMLDYVESPDMLFCPSEEQRAGSWDISKSWAAGDNYNQVCTYGLRERGIAGQQWGYTVSLDEIQNPSDDYMIVDEWCRVQFKPWYVADSSHLVEMRHNNKCNTLYSDGSVRATGDEYYLNVEGEEWLEFRISYPEDKFLPRP